MDKRGDFDSKAFLLFAVMVFLCGIIIGFVTPRNDSGNFELVTVNSKNDKSNKGSSSGVELGILNDETGRSFKVLSVVDGDTIKIDYFGNEEYVRLIGINTHEVDGPYTDAECFGAEASAFAKSQLEGRWVTIEGDSSQGDRDKYDRLLRYVYLDGSDFGGFIIQEGYGYEYTYNVAYIYRDKYIQYQEEAKSNKSGLWADGACINTNSQTSNDYSELGNGEYEDNSGRIDENGNACNIKGNISVSTGEKIYHMPGQEYYEETRISPEYGERWFCSEEEAIAAGWRRAKDNSDYVVNDGSNDGGTASKNSGDNQGSDYIEVQDDSYSGSTEAEGSSSSAVAKNKTKNNYNYSAMTPFGAVVFAIIFLMFLAAAIMWAVMLIECLRERMIGESIVFLVLLAITVVCLCTMIKVAIQGG